MLTAAGCRDRTGFHYITANGAFLMLRTVSGSRCRSVGDPFAGGMCRFLSLCAAGAFMPVVDRIRFPIRAVAVGMLTAAGCRDRTGFHYITALGAFLMLCTVSGSRCFGVGDPVAGGMSCFAVFKDDAAANNRTFFPMVICIKLPIGRSMTSCPNDHTGLVGNFHRTGCVLKPLITAVTCVICFVARCGASCRIFINKRQIMGMRNGIIIGTDIADVIVSVIMSRFVFL